MVHDWQASLVILHDPRPQTRGAFMTPRFQNLVILLEELFQLDC